MVRLHVQDQGGEVLFDHGPPRGPRVNATAALNALTYAPPSHAKRAVSKDLWAGAKANDLGITMSLLDTSGVSAAKARAWAVDNAAREADQWQSAARGAALEAALGAAAVAGDAAAAEACGIRRTQARAFLAFRALVCPALHMRSRGATVSVRGCQHHLHTVAA
jgi:hypothetical protein